MIETRPVNTVADPTVAAPEQQPARATTRRRNLRPTALVLLLFMLVTSVYFYEVVFLGRTLVTVSSLNVMGFAGPYGHTGQFRIDLYRPDPGASSWAMLPWTQQVAAAFAQGRAPLWNESQGMGAPLLANAQSGGFDIMRLPVWLSPSPLGWDLYYLARSTLGTVFAYLFARSIGLARVAAVTSAVAYVYSGHFMMLSNNTWATAYYLLPLLLYSVELLLAGRRIVAVPAIAGSVAWCVYVGMPEVTLFVLGFAACYTAYRLIGLGIARRADRVWLLTSVDAAVGWIAGVALAAPLLLPLFELVGQAGVRSAERATHGLVSASLSELAIWFIPYLTGPALARGQSMTQHYVGTVVLMLALYAIVSARSTWREHHGPFLACATLLILAKIFGVPGINALGSLPGLNVTWILKWAAPVAGFGLALLAGIAVHRLVREAPQPRAAAAAFAITVAIVFGSIVFDWDAVRQITRRQYLLSVGVALALSAALLLVMLAPWRRLRGAVGVAACLIVGFELFLYAPSDAYQDRFDWRREPPYVSFLKERIGGDASRIFAADALMFPNLASEFGLHDVRSLDALYSDRYMTYLRTMVNPKILDRFVGGSFSSPEAVTPIGGNRGLDLAGVRFVIALPGSLTTGAMRGNLFASGEPPTVACPPPVTQPQCAGMTNVHQVTMDGVGKVALFDHPPASIRRPLTLPNGQPVLRFSVGLDQHVWDAAKGDGVAFEIAVESAGQREVVYRREIDPKQDAAQRRWLDESVDLSRFSGREVTLVFTTDSLATSAFDWANWGDIRIETGQAPTTEGYTLVYDREVAIFENRRALPRAFIPEQVRTVPSMAAATALLREGTIDVRRVAVVESGSDAPFQGLGSGGSATIAVNTADRVVVEVDAAARALLVLTDLYYPGWVASIDGQPTEIYATDLAFRGVVIPEGRHVVEFAYRPASFGIGVGLAAGALLVVLLTIAAPRFVPGLRALYRPD